MSWFETWPADRIAILRREWEAGTTASKIATILGNTTRNAVLGKAHRLGLTSRVSPIGQTVAVIEKRKASNKQRKERLSRRDAFRTEALDELVRTGYSPETAMPIKAIAAAAGCSEASVMRRAKELGHVHPSKVPSPKPVPTVAAATNLHQIGARLVAKAPAMAPGNKDLPLREVGAKCCQFPTSPDLVAADQHRFCGAPIELPETATLLAPYCAFHFRLARRPYVPPIPGVAKQAAE